MARVLFLGLPDSPVREFLASREAHVVQSMDRVDIDYVTENKFDFIISYNYRYIVEKSVIALFHARAVNLHIALLPWNRGADPNLWSFVEGTPKGVSIHYMDEGVDTGDIIVQKEVGFAPVETLRSTYTRLHEELRQLFYTHWERIRDGTCQRTPQSGEGSFHRLKDKERIAHLLVNAWDTPVSRLEQYGAGIRQSIKHCGPYHKELKDVSG